MPITINSDACSLTSYSKPINSTNVSKQTQTCIAGVKRYDNTYSVVYRGRFEFTSEEFKTLDAAGVVSKLQSLTITLKVNECDGWAGDTKTVQVRTYTSSPDRDPVSGRYNTSWDAMDTHYAEHDVTISKVGTLSLTIADETEIRNIINYGIGIVDTSTGTTEFKYSTTNPVRITFTSKVSNPVIAADKAAMTGGIFSGNTYIHDPAKDFRAAYTYTQEAGGAMETATVQVLRGTTVLYSVTQTTQTAVAVPASAWGDLPVAGVIRITACTEPIGGRQGKTVFDIPFRVAYREVTPESHAPEETIDSDTDLDLVWNNTVIAQGDASCSAPVFWKVWVMVGEASQGILAREPRVTVAHGVLIGLESITVRIETFYTEDGVVGTYGDNGYSMRLWVRQVAEAGTVSIVTDGYGTVPPLPVVKWESVGQTAFRVRFGKFESGAMFGSAVEYAVPKVFEDGTYPVQVSVQDKNGRWGVWTSPVYAIVRNRAPSVVCNAEIRIQGGRVMLDITGDGNAVWYAIYRDGELIGQVAFSGMVQYTDPWVNGEAIYEVLAVTSDGYYATTGEMPVTLVLSDDVLTDKEGRDIVLRYTKNFPREYVYKKSEDVHMVHFAGRAYPVAFHSGNFKRSITLSYTDSDKGLADMISECDGANVFFRDVEGGSIFGVLGKLQVQKSLTGCAVSFEIQETDRCVTGLFVREGV